MKHRLTHKKMAAAGPAPEQWSRQIRSLWAKRATNTLELARLVCQARQSLRYGAWGRMWVSWQSPFSKRTADKLVSIGRHLGGLDENNCAHLPTAWNALYWLSLLGATTVESCIKDGNIHPGMTPSEARQLLAKYRGHPESRGPKRLNLRQRLRRFGEFVLKTMNEWEPEDRNLAAKALALLLEQIGTPVMAFERNGDSQSFVTRGVLLTDQRNTL